MDRKLTKAQQDAIVVDLIVGLSSGDMDPDEAPWQELYGQLDPAHRLEVDQGLREFADNAVGDEHWDSDS